MCSFWEQLGHRGYGTPTHPSAGDKTNRGRGEITTTRPITHIVRAGSGARFMSSIAGDSIETPLLLGCSGVNRVIQVPLGRNAAQFGIAKQ